MNEWTRVFVSQTKADDAKYRFSVRIGDDVVAEVENTQPEEFDKVKVWAGDNFYEPALARIDDFRMISFDKGDLLSLSV